MLLTVMPYASHKSKLTQYQKILIPCFSKQFWKNIELYDKNTAISRAPNLLEGFKGN